MVASRGVPSSLSAHYGPAVPLGDPSGDGPIVVPTGTGVEIRDTAAGGVPVIGVFRTAGAVAHAAVSGTSAFLFLGKRGLIALDLSDPASPVAAGSLAGLGDVVRGAASPSGYGLAAASDSVIHFLAWTASGDLSLLRTIAFTDGRRVNALAARSDSFLVASSRGGVIPRLILTLYRLRAGAAAPESLAEAAFNGHDATDLAWVGPLAFVADGNQGVLVVNMTTRSIVRVVAVQGNKLVRSLDANDTSVVATAQGRTLAKFRRAGAAGDSLADPIFDLLEQEPIHARIRGGFAIVSTVDLEAPPEPDEEGRGALEFAALAAGAAPAPVGGTGRTRRVAWSGGYAFVADYTGGLRVYRAAGPDSALVGVLPAAGIARVYDVALDPARNLAYLASGAGGLDIVDVTDPAVPTAVTNVPLPGLASAVALAGSNLVAVARRGGSPGVTFVDVTAPGAPVVRGSVEAPLLEDPRTLAARDTILFVADETLGVLSVGFGDPDAPARRGVPSGFAARDLDLAGDLLLVATRSRGLQIVDVFDPASPILRAEIPTPPALGVARSGASAALFLGEEGVLIVDVQSPSSPAVRGPIATPGAPRDGAWSGDTLLIAAALGLERYTVAAAGSPVPGLAVRLDPAGVLPRASITWGPVSLPGIVGLNLYRDLGPATAGTSDPGGRRVNPSLLDPGTTAATDDALTAGVEHRYRLEAFFADGSSRKVAEGTLFVPIHPRLGRPYPNPYRPHGGVAFLPYRVLPGPAGRILTLRVYDAVGRLVRTATATAPAAGGFGNVTWDGRDKLGRRVPDGIYFLQLRGAGLDDSRAVTLLR